MFHEQAAIRTSCGQNWQSWHGSKISAHALQMWRFLGASFYCEWIVGKQTENRFTPFWIDIDVTQGEN